MDRVLLIDGTALVYRAYFAIPAAFSTSSGLPTNATYGFALMFRKMLGGKTPRFGAVVFDPPGPTFRDEKYPMYKAQRPPMPDDMRPQLPWIHKVVQAHDFPLVSVPGFEADDVIGTLTERARAAGHEVWIVSGDKDFAQLVRPGVRMLDTMRDITYDEDLVRKKWGVRPDQFVDHLALMGDSSDNIPGVPGIGQKTSAALLERYGDLEGVYAHLDELKGKQRDNLRDNRDQAFLSRELATIDREVPLEIDLDDLVLPPVDAARVNALYRELEFDSLLDDSDRAELRAAPLDIETAESPAALRAWIDAARDRTVALFTVTDGGFMGELTGLALATDDGSAIYAPIRAPQGALGSAALEPVAELTGDPAASLAAHDFRDTLAALERAGVQVAAQVLDVQLASFLCDPTGLIPHELDRLARHYLQHPLTDASTAVGTGQARVRFDEAEPGAVARWACDQAVAIAQMTPALTQRLEAEGQRANHDTLALPLARVLARMQLAGVRVDTAVLAALQDDFSQRRQAVEARVHELAGRPFNIGSPKQLGDVLFDELKLPVVKRTKSGYSTAADVLERLASRHEIAGEVLRWRALDKLVTTYTTVLQAAVHPATGRIHATFQQTAGASGRLITTDPDLQRTPIRTEDGKRIREAFVPRDGWVFVSADWSQIELRVLAHVSKDPLLVRAFNERVDLHRQTAARIFDVAPDDVTPEQRNIGKTVNFATIYGQGATALGQQLDLTRNQAKAMIDRYFETYAGVRAWLDATIASAHEQGFVETLAGRRRYIPELTSNNWTDRGYGERIAANTPIQGSAADICKMAMIRIDEQLRSAGLACTMMVQIHDELLFECPPDELEAATGIVRHCMEHCVELDVPLVVDIGHGASWAEAH